MVKNSVAQRRLYEMGAGVLGLLAVMMIVGPAGEVNGINLLLWSLIFTAPALYLLRKAAEHYVDDIDNWEVVGMMITGASFFLFVSIVVVTLFQYGVTGTALGMSVVSFVVFFVPAAIIYLLNTRRQTETISPIT